MAILDSGSRTEFESGAVRDIKTDVGRCDLMPLKIVSMLLKENKDFAILTFLEMYIYTGKPHSLFEALRLFITHCIKTDLYSAMLDVSTHYRAGCEKYGERNWEKGIPLHSYIDSATRHYLKYRRGDTDERHDLAFMWNILCCLWTHENKPEYIDLPFKKNLVQEKKPNEI